MNNQSNYIANFLSVSRLGSFVLIILALWAAEISLMAAPKNENQAGNLQIIVSGRPLPPTATGEMRGLRTLLPVVAIAQELGYLVNIDYQNQIVNIRRKGITVSFVKQSGEIIENNITVAIIPGTTDVSFTPNQSGILLPSEVLSRLLDVSVAIDRDKGIARIETRDLQSTITTEQGRKLDVRTLNYEWGVIANSGSINQTLSLNSSGRFGSSAYQSNVFLIGGGRGPYYFQGGNLTILRPKNVRIQLGDFITSNNLLFMATSTRGVSYEQPLSDRASFAVFGGKSFSGNIELSNSTRNAFANLKYDTTILGSTFSYNLSPTARSGVNRKTMSFNAGTTYFNGPRARGTLVEAGFRYDTNKLRFNAEAGIGNFNGTTLNGRSVSGFGIGVNVSASYTPWTQLTFQGQLGRYSPNFLSPQQLSQYTDRTESSFGITYRPSSRLSFGIATSQGNTLTRNNNKTKSYIFSAAYDPPVNFLPRVNGSYDVIDSTFGRIKFTRLNFTREYGRFRPYFDYTRIDGSGVSDTYSGGTGLDTGRYGYFQVQQTFTVGRSKTLEDLIPCQLNLVNPVDPLNPVNNCPLLTPIQTYYSKNGSVDWFARKLLFKRVQLGGGIGYVENNNKIGLQTRVNTNILLPHKQTFQFSYQHSGFSNELRFSLSGPIAFWKKPREVVPTFDTDAVVTESTIRGRVYIDTDFNRDYTPGIDKAIEGVMVILNGGRSAVSDVNGNYFFDRIEPGDQKISVRMEDIRADLVPFTELEQTLTILPRTVVTSDVRLVKSGRVTGRLFQDINGNGQYDTGEPTLTDIHILSTSGKDTYTDSDGTFLLSDLPPGEQIIYIDSQYLSGDLYVDRARLVVPVVAGQETKNQHFIYGVKPRPVEEKIFTSKPEMAKVEENR